MEFQSEQKSNTLILVNAKQKDIDDFKWPNKINTLYIRNSWIDHLLVINQKVLNMLLFGNR
jgi:hypothetical protein